MQPYDFGTRVCLAIAGPGVKGGRIVDDFVCLPDLAPTFLEAGETKIPDLMSARSLWNILKSEKSGWVDPKRDANITGRERHVQIARVGQLPYPNAPFAQRTSNLLSTSAPIDGRLETLPPRY